MLRRFSGDRKIKVYVANGSTINIWCRVAGDKMLKVQGETGGGVDVHSIGVNVHNAEQFQHIAGATRGYSQIQRGNTLQFESSTSSNSVYMTIISAYGVTICKNHEIGRSRNYIIDRRGALLDAKKKKMWIDTNGHDHMVTCVEGDEYGFDTKECGDIKQDSRGVLFDAKKKKMWKDTNIHDYMVTFDDDDEYEFDTKVYGDIKQDSRAARFVVKKKKSDHMMTGTSLFDTEDDDDDAESLFKEDGGIKRNLVKPEHVFSEQSW
jgi:hypothetical protein